MLRLLQWEVGVMADGLDGAGRFTGTTVDALIGMDVELALTLIDAVDRTLQQT
jgi:hypothetical protein